VTEILVLEATEGVGEVRVERLLRVACRGRRVGLALQREQQFEQLVAGAARQAEARGQLSKRFP
jgi:hypothetical protein